MPGEWINVLCKVADLGGVKNPDYQIVRFMPGMTVTPNADSETYDVGIDDVLATPIVANLEELAALNDTDYEDYREVFVITLLDYFQLMPTGIGIDEDIDPVMVVFPPSGEKRWVRQCRAHQTWANRVSYYVDTEAGNDEAIGDAGNPLASVGELLRRVGRLRFANFTITAYVIGGYYGPESYLFIDIDQFSTLVIKGALQASAVFSGEITAVQPPDGTGLEWQITIDDSGQDFSEAGLLILINNVPHEGSSAWVSRDLTGGVARTCGWRSLDDLGGAFGISESSVGAGSTYDAYVDPFPVFNVGIYCNSGTLQMVEWEISSGPYSWSNDATIDLIRCIADDGSVDFSFSQHCFHGAPIEHNTSRGTGPHRITSGVMRGLLANGGKPFWITDLTLDGGSDVGSFQILQLRDGTRCNIYSGEQSAGAGLAIFSDFSEMGIDINPQSSIMCSALIYGAVPSGDGIWVHGDATLGVSAGYPAISYGSGRDVVRFGEGSDRTDGTVIPHQDPAGSGARQILATY